METEREVLSWVLIVFMTFGRLWEVSEKDNFSELTNLIPIKQE
jgi:hypothetical protein